MRVEPPRHPPLFRRVVLDTNVLISAALSGSTPPARVVRHFLDSARILFSRETFSELETRLWRPKFDRYLTIEDRRLILHDLGAVAEWVNLTDDPALAAARWSRDSSDDKFVRTALVGKAELLITGDRDLLDLGTVHGVTIVTPADALTRIGRS